MWDDLGLTQKLTTRAHKHKMMSSMMKSLDKKSLASKKQLQLAVNSGSPLEDYSILWNTGSKDMIERQPVEAQISLWHHHKEPLLLELQTNMI